VNIPFSPPDITELEIHEVVAALQSGWITTGARTKELEKQIAEYIGLPRCVCLNSATAAMEMTLRVLGIGPGDEVITTAYTYTATASVIDHVGARIVMVDTLPDSFELNYQQVADAITENTKAIIPVDLGGRLCDYSQLHKIVKGKKSVFRGKTFLQKLYGRVVLVADSAHGFGAEYRGTKSGNFADFTNFSFHAVKNFTTGEGGAVVWKEVDGLDNDALYKEYMLFSLHGQSKDALAKTRLGSWEYDIIYPAYKCNMTDLQAAIGLKQMERYEDLLARRKEIIERYDETVLRQGWKRLSHFDKENKSSGHLYLLRIPGIGEEKRNRIIEKMAEAGIATNVHYKPLPMMTAYRNKGFSIEDFPNAYNQYKNEITLPLHTKLTTEEVEYICSNLVTIVKGVV
jgi:dTDP-4-amino-4,6-dideoxygalactose transaminase